jgi:LysR family transcriptional regulator, transcriptional activator for dmlA
LDTARSEMVRVQARLSTNDGGIAVQWALDGLGILLRAEWDIQRDLASGRLVQILPGYRTPDADIYAICTPRHQATARVREFIDSARKHFQVG